MAQGLLYFFLMGFLFEKLDVYQRAMNFAERVISLADELPRGQAALADQFKRAALSIPLNIAEGNGRWHAKDRKNFFIIARGSAFECVPLLELCCRRGWMSEEDHKERKSELGIISKMLSALANARD